MRGIDTPVRQRRRRVFKEVANLAYNSTNLKDDMEALPYKIVDYEESEFWESVYRDRAIIRERIRLAMGMSLRPENREHPGHLTQGLEESNIDEKYYEPPLMQVIPSACNACPENRYEVTSSCMGCLAHPCQSVCPKGAISMKNGMRSNENVDVAKVASFFGGGGHVRAASCHGIGILPFPYRRQAHLFLIRGWRDPRGSACSESDFHLLFLFSCDNTSFLPSHWYGI